MQSQEPHTNHSTQTGAQEGKSFHLQEKDIFQFTERTKEKQQMNLEYRVNNEKPAQPVDLFNPKSFLTTSISCKSGVKEERL